tara:strand:+ start:809 stop:2080 length:1272 start_codon:yes stop_codon:yes gene_type:complete
MKTKRNTKNSIMNSKSKVSKTYKNSNPRLNIINNKDANNIGNNSCAGLVCLNSINIKNIKWDVWNKSDKLDYGRLLLPGTDVDISFNGLAEKIHLGKIKDTKITNNKSCLKIGYRGCSEAFKDCGINVNIIIESNNNCNDILFQNNKTIYFNNTSKINNTLDDLEIGDNNVIIKPIKRKGSMYRAPILGYRKTLCNNNNTQEVYKDPYSLIFNKEPDVYEKVCYDQRIRSGMQEKKIPIGCDNKCCDKQKYNFSYNEYNKNYKLNTYQRGLEINKPIDGKTCLDNDCVNSNYVKSGGDSCNHCRDEKCNNNKLTNTVWKPNNNKFKVQGSVSSSLRIDRLKLDTIKVANSKCSDNKCITLENNEKIGRGSYFAGKPRFDGWMFNKNHAEIIRSHKQLPFGIPQLTNNKNSRLGYRLNKKVKFL